MLKVTNIKWDTDGNVEALDELPVEIIIQEYIEEEDICDHLSDEYGYCVFGFDVVINKEFKALFIDGKHSGYSPDQCDETMTVDQMIEWLIELRDCENAGDCPIYLINDGGYTYGHINEDTMNFRTYTEE